MAKKTIRIDCEGAATVSIDELTQFQGNLKFLPEERYQKLRSEILELGYSFVPHVWKSKNIKYILDGHQRIFTLKRMRDEEKFEIPSIPVAWVKAKSPKEAARKVLGAISQYGQVTGEGLHQFMTDFKLDLKQVSEAYEIPSIDFTKFEMAYFPESKVVSFTAKPKPDEHDVHVSKPGNECPKCGWVINEAP